MGEWKAVYEDEVEGRWVKVRIYESEDDTNGDEDSVVRVTVAPIDDRQTELGQAADGQPLPPQAETANNLVTLEPDPVEDLEEELIEIGFSPKAAAWIMRKVPM